MYRALVISKMSSPKAINNDDVILTTNAKRPLNFDGIDSKDYNRDSIHGTVTIEKRPEPKSEPEPESEPEPKSEPEPTKIKRTRPTLTNTAEPDTPYKCTIANVHRFVLDARRLYTWNCLRINEGLNVNQRTTTLPFIHSIHLSAYLRNSRQAETNQAGMLAYRLAVIKVLDGTLLLDPTSSPNFFEASTDSIARDFDNDLMGVEVLSLPINREKYRVYYDTKGILPNNINLEEYNGFAGSPGFKFLEKRISINERCVVQWDSSKAENNQKPQDNIYICCFWCPPWYAVGQTAAEQNYLQLSLLGHTYFDNAV